MHKEKVDAILLLDEPKDHHNLQVFLGMLVYCSVYIPFYAWINGPLFNLLKGSVKWEWTEVHSEAFELCKLVLVNAPVHGYTKPGSPYRSYSDACDFVLATILQQVQRIQLKDLARTKAYEHCEKAFEAEQLILGGVGHCYAWHVQVPLLCSKCSFFKLFSISKN